MGPLFVLLTACAAQAPAPVPGHLQAVKVESTCPPTMVAQARWLQSNLARVALGMDKLSVTGVIGNPARAESFLLTDGSSIEVLFYHTASTVCRRPDVDASLLPFVFQNNRLLGYGQNYYHDFIMPQLRQTLPQEVTRTPAMGAAYQGGAGRTMSEDLPGSQPRVEGLNRGRTIPPRDTTVPTSPEAAPDGARLGRGAPLPYDAQPAGQ